MSTHIDTLAEWWERADNDTVTHPGDTIIQKNRAGFDVFEVAHEDAGVHISGLPRCRILHRAPKPEPAWHNGIAVLANHRDYPDEDRTVWTREGDPSGHDWSDAHTAMAAPHHLVNVTPLIEQKVTGDMIDRIEHHFISTQGAALPVGFARRLLSIALNLDPA